MVCPLPGPSPIVSGSISGLLPPGRVLVPLPQAACPEDALGEKASRREGAGAAAFWVPSLPHGIYFRTSAVMEGPFVAPLADEDTEAHRAT